MTRPLFSIAKLNDESFCICRAPASFEITVALTEDRHKFCATCAITFTLQFMKNEGVQIDEIQNVFTKLSIAADAPLSSSLVM